MGRNPFRACAPIHRDWFCADSMTSLRTTNMNFPLTIFSNFASAVALISLFIWSTKYIFQEGEGGNRWRDADGNWTFEMKGAEESTVTKIMVDLGFLLFTNLLVAVKTCKVFNRHYDRMDVGGLAGCTGMFSQMLFVSFWYMLNIGVNDDQQNNNQNNYYGQNIYWQLNEEERRRYDQNVIAFVSLVLAIIYAIISFSVYCEGVSMPELHPEDTPWQTDELDVTKGAVRLDMLANFWKILSPATVITFGILLIATSLSLITEDGDRLRDEGDVFNLIAVLTWLLMTSVGLAIIGRAVLGRQSQEGTLHIGLLAGGGEYFSGLLLLVSILYFSPVIQDRRKEDEHIAGIVTSFVSIILCILHFGFSMFTKKYKRSISRAIPIFEDQEGYIEHDDFVHVQGGGDMELA